MGYERGLIEVADGVYAYLQPDGTWGWSNAGLIVGNNESALVDTLFDLKLTQAMLDDMAQHTKTRPIANLVNTHANGDHCYGNQLVTGPGVEVIASEASAAEMDETPPSLLAALAAGPLEGTLGTFFDEAFGSFDFNNIDTPAPTLTFSGRHDVDAGGRKLELIEVGPAHTGGDIIAWLPDERVVFAGDILFIGGTPIIWSGPLQGWIAAIDTILALDPSAIVPGHGPMASIDDVKELRSYLVLLGHMVSERHAAGLGIEETTKDVDALLDNTTYGKWTDRERIVVNVQSIWRELDPDFVTPDVLTAFQGMADNHANRKSQA